MNYHCFKVLKTLLILVICFVSILWIHRVFYSSQILMIKEEEQTLFDSPKNWIFSEIHRESGTLTKVPRRKIVNNQRVTKIMGMNPFIQNAFEILDTFKKPPQDEVDTYSMFKSMVMSWNMEASKWALNASNYYRSLLEKMEGNSNLYHRDFSTGLVNKSIRISECNCDRWTMGFDSNDTASSFLPEDSTCSQHAFQRGPHQRVIGFSFYGSPDSKLGKERKYFEGILDNLNLIPKFYPGWILRLYYDLPPKSPLLESLCTVACTNPSLDLCHVRRIPSEGDISDIFPMNWRFLPILDPQVDIYVSRDLDSRLNQREADAVNEWLAGNKAFHFMRDHPAHSIEILGSGWGLRLREPEREMVQNSFKIATKDSIFWATRNSYGPDQGFLKRYLWPWGKWNSLSHDAYSCAHFARTSPFPTERKIHINNFVAAVVSANDTLKVECPLKCRKNPSWTYC